MPPGEHAAADNLQKAVFLHGFWRCGGTFLWSGFRALHQVRAYYEPLHEQLATLRQANASSVGPGSWASGHSHTPPYFEEYRDLIPARQRGVRAYHARFAFDDFFLDASQDDPLLEAYLASLLRAAAADGLIMVAKFCRSLGRVGWMEARFPDALHAVLLRDPAAQFASSVRLLQVEQNRYFVTAPLAVLARNAGHAPVEAAAATMGVALPALRSRDHAYTMETCWRHVRGLDWAQRYRVFLTFWTLSAVAALRSSALVIDQDELGTSPAYQEKILAAVAARTGLTPTLAGPERPLASFGGTEPVVASSEMELAEAHAARVVEVFGSNLPPARRAIILGKLRAQPLSAAQAAPEKPGAIASFRVNAVPASIEVGLARGLVRLRGIGWYAQQRMARLIRNGNRDA